MQHGSTRRRSRNRSNSGRRGNQGRVQVFDSNGPDVRIRGTAHQIHEKYVALAKDAASSGDLVLAESYLQYAEHYQRIITNWDEVLRNGGRVPEKKEEPVSEDKSDSEDKDVVAEEDLGLPESVVGKPEAKAVEKTAEKGLLEDA